MYFAIVNALYCTLLLSIESMLWCCLADEGVHQVRQSALADDEQAGEGDSRRHLQQQHAPLVVHAVQATKDYREHRSTLRFQIPAR